METRANFLVIGVCTLLAIAGALGFLVWLAQFEVNRQFNYYNVIFENVSGLSRASDVRFNGLTVGQVVSIGLSEHHPGKVSAKIEVAAGTPINEDTTAQLAAQGVTGVSFVSLTSGRDDAAPLKSEDGELPEIFARRSVVEALQHDAPDLVAQAKGLVEDVRKVFTPALADQVNRVVGNLDKASQDLGGAFADFSKIASSVSLASGQVGKFTDRLDPIGDALQTSLANLDTALTGAKETFTAAQKTLGGADVTLDTAKTAIGNADTVLEAKLPQIMDDLSETTATLRTAIAEISSGANHVVSQAGDATDSATSRMNEIKATIANLDATLAKAQTALASVAATSDSVRTLVDGEGAGLVSDARSTLTAAQPGIASLSKIASDQLPATVAQVHDAAAGISGGVDRVATQAGQAADAATARLEELKGTIASLDATLGKTQTALASVTATSDSARTLVDGEGTRLVTDARATLAAAKPAIESLNRIMSDEVPGIVAQLKDAVASANRVIDDTGKRIDAIADGVQPLSAQATTSLAALTEQSGTTLEAATRTMQDASATLTRIDGAIGSAEGALTAAQGTFTSAQRVMDEDVSPTAADIREAASGINASVAKVASDLPAITDELHSAIAKANTVIGRVDAIVATSAPPIDDFTRNGLPQFVRFTAEARALVAQLDALTARIERDPAGFLLGSRAPDFRR
ncbi:MAG: MlaD family protein [Amaricoccus sp.]